MKQEIKVRILIDTDKDEFGIATDYYGFDENTPSQNSLVVASILEIARHQELEKFYKK